MICPSCGDEFRSGFDSCPDCEVDLVEPETVEDASERDHPESVELLWTADPGFLAIAKSILESASIPYSGQGEESMVLYGSPSSMAMRLFVPADRYEEARDLMTQAEIEVGEDTAAEDAVDEKAADLEGAA